MNNLPNWPDVAIIYSGLHAYSTLLNGKITDLGSKAHCIRNVQEKNIPYAVLYSPSLYKPDWRITKVNHRFREHRRQLVNGFFSRAVAEAPEGYDYFGDSKHGVFEFVFNHVNTLYLTDYYTKRQLRPRNGWYGRGFTGGGTVNQIVVNLHEYIMGKYLYIRPFFSGWLADAALGESNAKELERLAIKHGLRPGPHSWSRHFQTFNDKRL